MPILHPPYARAARTLLLAGMVLAVPPALSAQSVPPPADSLMLTHLPPVIVTATRTPAPTAAVASAVTVVTRAEIERRQYRTVLDALRAVPGVAVAQAGGPGGAAGVFLRGAAGDQTLVLLDGVQMNDPSAPAAAYDLGTLPIDAVERIEIVRGPQGALYGAHAMGGVIHILTRTGAAGPPSGAVTIEGGTFATAHGSAALTGGSQALRYALTVSRRQTDGISAADGPAEAARPERDAHDVTAVTARLAWHAANRLVVRSSLHVSSADTDIDAEGLTGDDPNAAVEADERAGRVELEWATAGGRWRQLLGAGASRHARSSRDDPDAARPQDRSRGRFDGATWMLEWLHELDLGADRHLTIGLEGERVMASSSFTSDGPFGPFASAFPDAVARTGAGFVEARAGLGARVTVSAAARLDAHSRFGRAGTYRAGVVVREPWAGARLHTTVGTGFTAPTLFQLFDPEFGDRGLAPERSRGWDAGAEQDLAAGRLRVGATVFRTRFEELIGFAFPDGYANIRAARTRGVEVTVSAFPSPGWRISAAHTALRTRDDSAGPERGAPLLRRPRWQSALDVGLTAAPFTVALGARWVGPRDDLDFSTFPAARVTLERYALLRLAAAYEVTRSVQLHGRLENALDAVYAEVLHFNAPGRAVYAGVSVAF